jgi:hypothetical protein
MCSRYVAVRLHNLRHDGVILGDRVDDVAQAVKRIVVLALLEDERDRVQATPIDSSRFLAQMKQLRGANGSVRVNNH